MARSFRESRFRSHKDVGEDVNPSAYIVNLADCMLVLACGFMVALMSFWNIDLKTAQDIDSDDLQDVTDSVDESTITGIGSSSYVEAGKAYQDPKTGKVYIIADQSLQGDDGSAGEDSSTAGDADTASADGQ